MKELGLHDKVVQIKKIKIKPKLGSISGYRITHSDPQPRDKECEPMVSKRSIT